MNKSISCLLAGLCMVGIVYGQNEINNWAYIEVDNDRQKWGDWDEPEWLRYFGLDCADLNQDGLKDIISGRYIYMNPGGKMEKPWERIVLEKNVDAVLSVNINDNHLADIIAVALPDVYWLEARSLDCKQWNYNLIGKIPATGHVNGQGYAVHEIVNGGKPEVLLTGNGGVYCAEIPLNPYSNWGFKLIASSSSDEGFGIGDITGNGLNDIVFAYGDENGEMAHELGIYINPGHINSEWEKTIIGKTDGNPIDRIRVADLNQNGYNDIILSEERYPGYEPDANLWWFEHPGDMEGVWDRHHIITQYSMNNLDVGDVDNDGYIDIVTNEHKGKTFKLQVFKNTGEGNFHEILIDTSKESHLGTRLTDLDGDGDLDLVSHAWDNYKFLHVWRNNLVQSFKEDAIYKEYHWLPGSVIDNDKFLRVGGKLDYITSQDHFKNKLLLNNGAIRIASDIDLTGAVSAEIVLERIQSHEDTRNLRVQINGNPWIVVPGPATIQGKASDYMFHHYPKINIPLNYIQDRYIDMKLMVDDKQRWEWPQNIFYGFTVRIYYDESRRKHIFTLNEFGNNGILETMQPLSITTPPDAQISKVDYIGFYEDVNMQGDGVYLQWQYNQHQTRLMNHIGSSTLPPFRLVWDTEWLSDQKQPIKVIARVETTDGLITHTNVIQGLQAVRDYSVSLIKPFNVPANWVTRSRELSQKLYIPVDPSEISASRLYFRSWSPGYSHGILLNGNMINEKGYLPKYDYYEHNITIENNSFLNKGENRLTTLLTPLYDGEMVHGMEVQWPGIMMKIKYKREHPLMIIEGSYEEKPHFIIRTDKIQYYYDKEGGGFSRIIDLEGNDWISFKCEPWDAYPASAASSFRGTPNLVFRGDAGGAGHPGHDKCISVAEGNRIITESKCGKWKWQWQFFDNYAVTEILKSGDDEPYWFLYEGTPGGNYEPGGYYYGTSEAGPENSLPDHYKGLSKFNNFKWLYAGHKNHDKVFFMSAPGIKVQKGIVGYLGNSNQGINSPDGMTVFGFGRNEDTYPLLKGPRKFVIGLYPEKIENKKDHEKFSKYIESINY